MPRIGDDSGTIPKLAERLGRVYDVMFIRLNMSPSCMQPCAMRYFLQLALLVFSIIWEPYLVIVFFNASSALTSQPFVKHRDSGSFQSVNSSF